MDGSTATQKTCQLSKARQTPSGPLPRLIFQPQGHSRKPNKLLPDDQKDCSQECTESPTIYYLKPVTRPKSAITRNLPSDCTYAIICLEPTKGDGNRHGPRSKILYCPATRRSLGNPCDSPKTVDCATKGPPSRMIERSASPPTVICSETPVPRAGGHSVAVVSPCPPENSISRQQGGLETRVGDCGPRPGNVSFPQDRRHYCCGMGSKSSEPAKPRRGLAKIICEEGYPERKVERKASWVYRSPPDCVPDCAGFKDPLKNCSIDCKDRAPRVERRNGLDPSDTVPQSDFAPRPRRQVCPSRCCPPTKRPKFERSYSGRGRQRCHDFAGPESAKCVSARAVLVKSGCGGYRGETEKLSGDCAMSKTSPEVEACESGRPTAKQIGEFVEGYVPRVRSQELATLYREHFSPSQLERYEACRSKRNGLQDECSLAVPHAVVQLKRQELFRRLVDVYKSDIGDLDQRVIDACAG
ncbi:uncharacterized protein LOC143372353 [Andrena cerasifolii]|uniref:uncharacterized protein LOC143372353 n=1 Tax=Andrena cerasifolii TaxID=2819439 RepID=UPI0040383ED4